MNFAFVGGLFDRFINWFDGIVKYYISFLPKTFYLMFTMIFTILDILQMFFRKAVGLDVLYMDNGSGVGEVIEGDIVSYFIGKILSGEIPILYNIFISMVILAMILLILSTIVAILRSEYMAEDSKTASKARVFGKSIKAVFSFIIVPMTCYFGLILGNAILQALDKISAGDLTPTEDLVNFFEASPVQAKLGQAVEQVKLNADGSICYDENGVPIKETVYTDVTVLKTSYKHYRIYGHGFGTTAVPLSGQVFRSAAYKANRFRYDSEFKKYFSEGKSGLANGTTVFTIPAMTNAKTGADFIDECFTSTYKLKSPNVSINQKVFLADGDASDKFVWKETKGVYGKGTSAQEKFYFDKFQVGLVWYFYDLWNYDWIIALGTLTCMTMIMINIIFAMIKRMFELVMLFLIAAPITSIMPLDNGEALKKWRTKFVGKAISAYSIVVCMNLFFILLGVLTTISWFGINEIDYFINALVAIIGLVTVKDMSATVSEIIGAEDAVKVGQDMQKEVGAKAAGMAKTMMGAAGLAAGAVGFVGKKVARAGGAIAGKVSDKYAASKAKKGLKDGKYEFSDGRKLEWKKMNKADKKQAIDDYRANTQKQKDKQKKNEDKNIKAYEKKHGTGSYEKNIEDTKKKAREEYDEKHGAGAYNRLSKPNKAKVDDKAENNAKQNALSEGASERSVSNKAKKVMNSSVVGGIREGVGGAVKRLTAIGTHVAQATAGNSDLFKSWKENGGTVSFSAFNGASNKDMDIAKAAKDSYKSEKARESGGDKLRFEKNAKIEKWRASHPGKSRTDAIRALGYTSDPLGNAGRDDGYRPPAPSSES